MAAPRLRRSRKPPAAKAPAPLDPFGELQSELIARLLSLSVEAKGFEQFLSNALATVTKLAGGQNGAVWLYNETLSEARLYLEYDGTTIAPGIETGRPPRTVRARTPRNREWWLQPHAYEDVETEPDLAPYLEVLRARNVKSMMVVPLRVGDRLIGAFAIQSSRRRKYRPTDLQKAAGVAYPAALVIELLHLASQGHRAALLADRGQVVAEVREAMTERREPGTAPALPGSDWGVDDHRLTRREQEVLSLMTDGETNRSIATRLGIAEATAKVHSRRILNKLGARNRAEAVSISLRRRVG